MYSLNAPVPGRVERIAGDLHRTLAGFDEVRERHSLLVKRLGDDAADYYAVAGRARRAVAGTPPIRARVSGIGTFDDPPTGTAPVVYLAVESPGIREVHDALVAEFGAVEGLEGDDYVPHVTLARGGTPDAVQRLRDRIDPDPVEWTITEFEIYDATNATVAGRISLPA